MLILTRMKHEHIIVSCDCGAECDIKIADVTFPSGQIKMGFQAPSKMRIWRDEIYRKLKKELSEKGD